MTPEELKAARQQAPPKGKRPSLSAVVESAGLTKPADPDLPSIVPVTEGERRILALTLRAGGMPVRRIAQFFNVPPRVVGRWLTLEKAKRKDGWQEFFDGHAVPLALDNLVQGLEQQHEGYTVETLKGAGLLGQKQVGDGGGGSRFAFQINIVAPSGETTQIVEGSIVGTARTLEGDGTAGDSDR